MESLQRLRQRNFQPEIYEEISQSQEICEKHVKSAAVAARCRRASSCGNESVQRQTTTRGNEYIKLSSASDSDASAEQQRFRFVYAHLRNAEEVGEHMAMMAVPLILLVLHACGALYAP